MNIQEKVVTNGGEMFDRPRPLPWVVEYTGYSKQSIYRLMRNGDFPSSIHLGGNKVAWMESDIHGWLNARIHASKVKEEVSNG